MTERLTIHPSSYSGPALDASMACVRSWPSDIAKAWTRNTVRQSRLNTDIRAIIASGSAVRDVEHSEDLDIVIVYVTRRPTLPRPSIDVDLRLYEKAEVLQELESGHDYLSWTIRYGRVLFERNEWWTRLAADWRHRVLLPSVSVARERASKARRIYNELVEIGDQEAAIEIRVSMLTSLARAALSSAGVFPKSRPELAHQLRDIDNHDLANRLATALAQRRG